MESTVMMLSRRFVYVIHLFTILFCDRLSLVSEGLNI